MVNRIINVPTAHYDTTGVSFRLYASRYQEAATTLLSQTEINQGFDPVPYQLLCQSLELHLKSFIWFKDKPNVPDFRSTYGHDLEKLWRHAKQRGLNKYAKLTPLRERVILLVGPYYKKRKLSYLDLDMIFTGYDVLKAEHRIIPTIVRLCTHLDKALREPILRAS